MYARKSREQIETRELLGDVGAIFRDAERFGDYKLTPAEEGDLRMAVESGHVTRAYIEQQARGRGIADHEGKPFSLYD